MKAFESWVAGVLGSDAVLWVEIFLLVFASLTLGYVVNRVILALESRARRTRTGGDDALLEACRQPAVWLVWVLGTNIAVRLAVRRIGSEWYALSVQGSRV